MLPAALLMELYDEQISRDEFERLSTPEDSDSMYNPYQPIEDPIAASAPRPPVQHEPTLVIKVPVSDSASSTSTRSSSPRDNFISYWQDLEVYSATSDEELGSNSSSSWTSGSSLEFNSKLYYRSNGIKQSIKQHCGRLKSSAVKKYCSFCFHNRESESVYTSHDLRDNARNITCPALFEVVCRYCGATGPEAHTPKYCPNKSYGQRSYFNKNL